MAGTHPEERSNQAKIEARVTDIEAPLENELPITNKKTRGVNWSDN